MTFTTSSTVYAERYIVARSLNHCCHGNETIRSLFIVVGVNVAVNNINVFSVDMEIQKWFSFALLSSYKMFLTAVNSNKGVFVLLQMASFMRHITLSSVACLAPPYFFILSHKRHDFRKKILLNVQSVFWFFLQLLSKTCLILGIIQRDIIIKVRRSSCKLPYSLQVLIKLEIFWQIFKKKFWIIKSPKSPSRGSRVVPCRQMEDGQTDVTNLIDPFFNFANASKNT
jgi:hypothetical protein